MIHASRQTHTSRQIGTEQQCEDGGFSTLVVCAGQTSLVAAERHDDEQGGEGEMQGVACGVPLRSCWSRKSSY